MLDCDFRSVLFLCLGFAVVVVVVVVAVAAAVVFRLLLACPFLWLGLFALYSWFVWKLLLLVLFCEHFLLNGDMILP